MRIVHVITRLIVGGAQENTLDTVLGLRERPDVTVNLIAGPTSGPEGSIEPELGRFPGLLTVLPTLVRPVNPWYDVRAWSALVGMFRDRKPDIVHTHSGKAGVLGRLAAARAGVPCIVHTIHGPSFGPFQGPVANGLFGLAERVAGRVTSHFVVVAEAMKRQYLAAGIGRPEQYTRIFSGFRLEPYLQGVPDPALRRELGFAPTDFVLGKIARLFAHKGHQDLLAVGPALIRRIPGIRFLLVGDGAWRARLERAAKARGLGEAVRFTGLVPPKEIPRYLSVMDTLVHLSEREGLARALPQALAAGKPIVAYDCDGAREVCREGETGFLVPKGDLDRLEDRIARLAADPELRGRLGRQGRQWVRQWFPVERMVEALYNLYRQLLNR